MNKENFRSLIWFLIILFLIIIFFVIPSLIISAEITSKEAKEIIENVKNIGIGIFDVGFITWMKSNWWTFVLALVGIGRILVYITPSKKDDVWYYKYVINTINTIGKIMSFDTGKKNPTP